VLGVRVLPRGLLRSGRASPDPWVPQALADELDFPSGHGVSVVASSGAFLLDQLGPELGG
jgi:hypothetical protein